MMLPTCPVCSQLDPTAHDRQPKSSKASIAVACRRRHPSYHPIDHSSNGLPLKPPKPRLLKNNLYSRGGSAFIQPFGEIQFGKDDRLLPFDGQSQGMLGYAQSIAELSSRIITDNHANILSFILFILFFLFRHTGEKLFTRMGRPPREGVSAQAPAPSLRGTLPGARGPVADERFAAETRAFYLFCSFSWRKHCSTARQTYSADRTPIKRLIL